MKNYLTLAILPFMAVGAFAQAAPVDASSACTTLGATAVTLFNSIEPLVISVVALGILISIVKLAKRK